MPIYYKQPAYVFGSFELFHARTQEAKITASTLKGDFTKITFKPDLARFGMHTLEPDLVALLSKRVYDMAGTF